MIFILPKKWGGGGDNYASTAASVYLSGAQLISKLTLTVIQFDSEKYDPGDNFNTETYRYTIPADGYYLVTFSGWMDITAGKYLAIEARKGTGDANRLCQTASCNGNASAMIVSSGKVEYMTEGEYIEFAIYHTNNAALNLHERADATWGSIIRVA